MDSMAYTSLLEASIHQWKKQGRKVVWIKLPIEHANLIEAVTKWMPCEEYAATPFVEKHELLKYIVEICLARIDEKNSGFSSVPIMSPSSVKMSFMYFDAKHVTGSKDANKPTFT